MNKNATYRVKDGISGKIIDDLRFVIGEQVKIVVSSWDEKDMYSIPVNFVNEKIKKRVRRHFHCNESQSFDANVPKDFLEEVTLIEKLDVLLEK